MEGLGTSDGRLGHERWKALARAIKGLGQEPPNGSRLPSSCAGVCCHAGCSDSTLSRADERIERLIESSRRGCERSLSLSFILWLRSSHSALSSLADVGRAAAAATPTGGSAVRPTCQPKPSMSPHCRAADWLQRSWAPRIQQDTTGRRAAAHQ